MKHRKNIFICLLMIIINIVVCYGSCNDYIDKESCMNACACCWTAVEVDKFKGYPVMDYRCRWFCNDDWKHQYDPTWFCNAVNLSIPLLMLAVVLLAVVCVLGILGIIGLCTLICLAYVWGMVRKSVFSFLGSNTGIISISIVLSATGLAILLVIVCGLISIVVGVIAVVVSILRVLFS